MAYARLSSKVRRRGLKPAHYEEHLTGWWHLYRLLGWLRLKGLATVIYSKPRAGSLIYKNGKLWKSTDIRLRKRFKLMVTGKLPVVKPTENA